MKLIKLAGRIFTQKPASRYEQLFLFVLASLAIIRLADDITSPDLDGPFDIYKKTRAVVDNSQAPLWIKEGIRCRWCASFDLGLIFGLILPARNWREKLFTMIGLSGLYNIYFRHTYGWPDLHKR